MSKLAQKVSKEIATRNSGGSLVKYDPRKGVKKVAFLEMAEKHFAKAKDATQLEKAIRAKLEAQAEFVLWWDTNAQKQAGRPSKKSLTDPLGFRAGHDGIPDSMTISRWRRRIGTPETFEATLQAAFARYVKLLEFDTAGVKGLGLSLSNEWYTPARYLEAAREVLGGIDLDPASSVSANERVKAATFFTAADNGLTKEWPGRVWLNPPYGGNAPDFVARLVEQFTAGVTTAAVLLVNAHSTDVAWFQPLWKYLLCFTDHRINFIVGHGQEQSGSNHGSVFVYLGPARSFFIDRFAEFGAVMERARL